MSRRDDTHLHAPYPELVEPVRGDKPYVIRDSAREPGLPSNGAVDQRRRWMWVPLGADARSVRRHEIGHTWLSPRLLPRVGFESGVLAAVEDARVNLALARIGIPVVLDFEGEAQVVMLAARDAKAGDAFALFQRTIASIGTSVAPALRALVLRSAPPIGPQIAAWMDRAEGLLARAGDRRGRPEAPFRVALAIARRLARELRAFGVLDAAGRARTASVVRCCVGHGADGEGLVGDLELDEALGGEGGGGRELEPGRLTVRTMPLAVALRARGKLRGFRAASEGSVLRYPQRAATDRAVFRRRRRTPGGTVLVDASGSMSLGVDDFDHFLRAVPIGTRVALYAGDGRAGELRVVAEGGRRAAAEHLARFARGNVVDLPALEWLAKQRAPRVWVSDGGVTGVGDQASARLTARCRTVRARAGIRRVGKLGDAAKLFAPS